VICGGRANIQPFWQAVMDIEASQVINFTGCNGLAHRYHATFHYREPSGARIYVNLRLAAAYVALPQCAKARTCLFQLESLTTRDTCVVSVPEARRAQFIVTG